jgi:uncharacterized membrane protein YgcG
MITALVVVGVLLLVILAITALVMRGRRAARETHRPKRATTRASFEGPIEQPVRRRRDETRPERYWGDHEESLRDWQTSRASKKDSKRRKIWAAGTAGSVGFWGTGGGSSCGGGGGCGGGGCGGGD